jgi:hypothetical protein
VILQELEIDIDDFEARTGWAVKPEGACKAEHCVPLPPEARTSSGRVDVNVVAERLGMPLVHDEESGLWALGPDTAVTGRALATATAPELELPDLSGRPFRLSSLRGQKVLLVAWASW